jgi:hypothetical protein
MTISFSKIVAPQQRRATSGAIRTTDKRWESPMAQHRIEIADRIANLMNGGKEAALNARISLQGLDMSSLGRVDFSLWARTLAMKNM